MQLGRAQALNKTVGRSEKRLSHVYNALIDIKAMDSHERKTTVKQGTFNIKAI